MAASAAQHKWHVVVMTALVKKVLAALTPIAAEDLVLAAHTYKRHTGLGVDSFHPRWFGWLSSALLQALACLLNTLEALGVWPMQVQAIIIAQIAKSGGGRRPIGLFTSLVRLWEHIRKSIVEQWRQTVVRPYHWASRGRSTEAAVYKQALQAEAAAARGLESAASLIDLVKAFEMIKLEIIWRRGLQLHFPPRLLRLILESCAFVRFLSFGGAFADGIHTLSAILAGGSFATDLLFIVLVGPCDTLAASLKTGDLCLFVDDLTLHTWGQPNHVAFDMDKLVAQAISLFEDQLELTVSRGSGDSKSLTITSAPGLARKLCTPMRKAGFKLKRHAKALGVDLSLGKPLCRSAQAKRIQVVEARKARYTALGLVDPGEATQRRLQRCS